MIEDAAHAIGSKYKNRKIGSFGDMVSFSFHPNKNMTTIEGGALILWDEAEAKKVDLYRFHGIQKDANGHVDVVMASGKFNMPDVGAAVGRQQTVHQVLQAVGLADDDLGVLRQRLGLPLHLQQLRGPADAAQRVLDFVRQAANQLSAGLVLGQQQFITRDAQVPVQRQDFHQQAVIAVDQHRGDRAVNGDGLLADTLKLKFAVDKPGAGIKRRAQAAFVAGEMRDSFCQRFVQCMPAADAKQAFTGRVEGRDAELAVQTDDSRGHAVKDGVRSCAAAG